MDRRTNTNKKMSLEGIAIIHAQNLLTILDSIINIIGDLYDHFISKRISIWIMKKYSYKQV